MTEVPTIELAHLTDLQKQAYILADNRLALNAGWDEELLRIELGELQADGYDLELTGFDLGEITALFAELTSGLTDPDTVERALAGVRPHLMVTDPPYGVRYDPE